MHVNVGDFIWILGYIVIVYGVFCGIRTVFRTPESIASRKIKEIGGELLSVATSTPLFDRSKPYLEEALKIEKKLIQAQKLEKKKRDRIRGAYKIIYILDGKKKVAYLIRHKDYIQTIGRDQWHYDWVEELE